MEARKHPRLSDLIQAGTLITRGRAHIDPMGSPGLESSCGVKEESGWDSEGATATATANGGVGGNSRVGLGFNWD